MFPNLSAVMASNNSSHNTWRNIIVPPTPFLHQQVIPSWNGHFLYLFVHPSQRNVQFSALSRNLPKFTRLILFEWPSLQAGGTTLWFPWRCMKLLRLKAHLPIPTIPTPQFPKQCVSHLSSQRVFFPASLGTCQPCPLTWASLHPPYLPLSQ